MSSVKDGSRDGHIRTGTVASRYFVWNPNGRTPSFEHPTESAARTEGERLARLNPGERFLILVSISDVMKNDVQWSDHAPSNRPLREEEIPF